MQTQHLELSGGRLAYDDYGGSGELVLLLPGMASLRSEYRYLAPRLRDAGYRVAAADLRGQGDSSVPWDVYDVPAVGCDIFALLEHFAAGPAHLVGNSFSGAPVVWAAAERPDLVRSLVLINPFLRNAKINPLMKAIFWLMMHNPWRVRTWGMYYASLFPTQKPPDFQEYLQRLSANLSEQGRFNAADALGASSRQPSDERLEQVQAPVLVMMGSKDPDFPDPAAEGRIIAGRSGGVLEVIDGAGHYPQSEMPDTSARVILDFLKSSA